MFVRYILFVRNSRLSVLFLTILPVYVRIERRFEEICSRSMRSAAKIREPRTFRFKREESPFENMSIEDCGLGVSFEMCVNFDLTGRPPATLVFCDLLLEKLRGNSKGSSVLSGPSNWRKMFRGLSICSELQLQVSSLFESFSRIPEDLNLIFRNFLLPDAGIQINRIFDFPFINLLIPDICDLLLGNLIRFKRHFLNYNR